MSESKPDQETKAPAETSTRGGVVLSSDDLLAIGYSWDHKNRIWWSGSSNSSGAALEHQGEDDIWLTCSMFDTGKIQYGDTPYKTAKEAAKAAIAFYS